jgi:hypothetical protein
MTSGRRFLITAGVFCVTVAGLLIWQERKNLEPETRNLGERSYTGSATPAQETTQQRARPSTASNQTPQPVDAVPTRPIGTLPAPAFVTNAVPQTTPATASADRDRLARATSPEERFYILGDIAKHSLTAGQLEEAQSYAVELMGLLPTFKNNWNYGNAVQDANLVLGRIALAEGQIDQAIKFLMAAGDGPGSPQMNSFGPNMSLAKDLLEKGERDAVLQYFGQCSNFWKTDFGKLEQWTQAVRAGKIPDFGANLLY